MANNRTIEDTYLICEIQITLDASSHMNTFEYWSFGFSNGLEICESAWFSQDGLYVSYRFRCSCVFFRELDVKVEVAVWNWKNIYMLMLDTKQLEIVRRCIVSALCQCAFWSYAYFCNKLIIHWNSRKWITHGRDTWYGPVHLVKFFQLDFFLF